MFVVSFLLYFFFGEALASKIKFLFLATVAILNAGWAVRLYFETKLLRNHHSQVLFNLHSSFRADGSNKKCLWMDGYQVIPKYINGTI
jgi:hypothetical protein